MMYGDMVPRGTPPSTNILMVIFIGLLLGAVSGLAVYVPAMLMERAAVFFERHVQIKVIGQ